jgi:hypothetical protein
MKIFQLFFQSSRNPKTMFSQNSQKNTEIELKNVAKEQMLITLMLVTQLPVIAQLHRISKAPLIQLKDVDS